MNTSGPPDPRPGPFRVLLKPLEWALAVAILIHDGLSWVFAPALRWIAALRLLTLLSAWVARLPAYAVLVLLILPLLVAEPMKILGLLLLATGRVIIGTLVLIVAYGLSLILVERIFTAGKLQLMTLGWFASSWRWFTELRARVVGWVRTKRLRGMITTLLLTLRTPLAAMRQRVRETLRRWFPHLP